MNGMRIVPWLLSLVPLILVAALVLLGVVVVQAGREKRTRDQLARTHTELKQLLDAISSILVGVDREERICRWNKAAQEAFSRPAAEVRGRLLRDCGIDWQWQRIREALDSCWTTWRPVRVDRVRFTRPDGNDGILGLTLNPVTDEHGAHVGILLLARDVTELETLQMQLHQAQKMRAIGQLAAGIAHEINTPTQYVGDNTQFLREGFLALTEVLAKYGQVLAAAQAGHVHQEQWDELQTLRDKADVDYLVEEIPRALQQSLEGISRVRKIVQAMKEFAHPDSGEKAPADINQAVLNAVTMTRNAWKYVADLEIDLDEHLPAVFCLPGETNQVILNLIVNAADAIAETAHASNRAKGKITVATRLRGDWVEIQVSDSGTGIPENIRPRIFEPFFTTKPRGQGSGQGLALARSVVVDKHGGVLDFTTEPGRGTTFIVRLPVRPADVTVPAAPHRESA